MKQSSANNSRTFSAFAVKWLFNISLGTWICEPYPRRINKQYLEGQAGETNKPNSHAVKVRNFSTDNKISSKSDQNHWVGETNFKPALINVFILAIDQMCVMWRMSLMMTGIKNYPLTLQYTSALCFSIFYLTSLFWISLNTAMLTLFQLQQIAVFTKNISKHSFPETNGTQTKLAPLSI